MCVKKAAEKARVGEHPVRILARSGREREGPQSVVATRCSAGEHLLLVIFVSQVRFAIGCEEVFVSQRNSVATYRLLLQSEG